MNKQLSPMEQLINKVNDCSTISRQAKKTVIGFATELLTSSSKVVTSQEAEVRAKGERILCAATWYKELPTANLLPKNIDTGVVLCGYRHGDMIYQLLALTGKRSVTPDCGEYEQGFLTDKNRFVGRKEAYGIAFKADQIHGPNKGQSENSIGLTSEDLY